MTQPIHAGKKAAGQKAASLVESGMIVGLGTGSTAYWAIQALGFMVRQGLQIKAIATSIQSEQLAKEWDIPLIPFAETDHLDVDIDGADEVDEYFNLIKGGGGALLREKIIASASKKMIVVVDESKQVKTLGKFPLPVEIIPFGWEITSKKIALLQCNTVIRKKDGQLFITDNSNYILDCYFDSIPVPSLLNDQLNNIPGVVENGLFIDIADTVIVGLENGDSLVLTKAS